MKSNMSDVDRIIRVLLGVALIVFYFTGFITGALGIVGVVIGAVLAITGVVGFCPLYALLHVSTRRV